VIHTIDTIDKEIEMKRVYIKLTTYGVLGLVVFSGWSAAAVTADDQTVQSDRVEPDYGVAGRNRIAFRFGAWRLTADPIGGQAGVIINAKTTNIFAGVQYDRYIRENLAITAGIDVLPSDSGVAVGSGGVAVGTRTVTAMSLGFQLNPMGEAAAAKQVKPYLAAGLGPVIGSGEGVRVGPGGVSIGTGTHGTIGGHIRGGFDLHIARSWTVGGGLGYNWMAGFSNPIGERDNYSGIEMHITLGWVFGKGKSR
jgi:hypothetical protein